jgi:hypothetical protein
VSQKVHKRDLSDYFSALTYDRYDVCVVAGFLSINLSSLICMDLAPAGVFRGMEAGARDLGGIGIEREDLCPLARVDRRMVAGHVETRETATLKRLIASG